MFAAQFDRFGPPEVLFVGSFPEPHAGPGEVRIRVHAAGISPVDLAIRAGQSPSKLELPHIPGVDAAGVVDEVGAGVSGVAVGDAVFGAVAVAQLGGASAEFAVLAFWALKPALMPWVQAAAGGTSIETATRALDLLELQAGMTLLIDGASGGVGSVAVLLALARGARVIGTGSAPSQAFIEQLGAVPISYGPGLADRLRAFGRVDAALDVAGAGSLSELIAITGTPASIVSIADFSARHQGVRLSLGDFGGEAHGRHGLARAAALFEQGRFRVPVQEVFSLAEIGRAHALAARGPRRGKVVLAVAAGVDGAGADHPLGDDQVDHPAGGQEQSAG
jgi:NADPH:quinone reductase-like Zn-dependent oxidoreductase